MKKIIILISILLFIFSCSWNKGIEDKTNIINTNLSVDWSNQWTISVDGSVVNFKWFDINWWKILREIIYSTFDNLVIEVGENIDFINWLNKFNWEELLIHLNEENFWIQFLEKLNWIEWNIMTIWVKSNNNKLNISLEEAKLFNTLKFKDKKIIFLLWNNIWIISCSSEVKEILNDICN